MATVADVMMPHPLTCSPESPVADVARQMLDCDCGAIPVLDHEGRGRVIGIITDRDIVVRCVADGLDPAKTTVADCMTTRVHVISPDASLQECAQLMQRTQVRRAPVVDSSQELVGIVSMADLVNEMDQTTLGQTLEQVSHQDTRQLYSEVEEQSVTVNIITPVNEPANEMPVAESGERAA